MDFAMDHEMRVEPGPCSGSYRSQTRRPPCTTAKARVRPWDSGDPKRDSTHLANRDESTAPGNGAVGHCAVGNRSPATRPH